MKTDMYTFSFLSDFSAQSPSVLTLVCRVWVELASGEGAVGVDFSLLHCAH